ncbi:hypothetical protein AOLI_G00225580 [Acnodon oligacanthus]
MTIVSRVLDSHRLRHRKQLKKMKAIIIFGLLFAVVYCHPVKRSASSSESSEEQAVAKPSLPGFDKGPASPPKAAPAQDLKAAAIAAASDEDTDDSDEVEDKNTESDTEGDSADSADSADTQDTDTDDSSESAESGETEATTIPAVTVEPTLSPIIDNGRGDSMGYPGDYKKTIIYVDANDIEKIPSPYKSYGPDKTEDLNSISMKTSHFDGQEANDVEKHLKVYKALQVHNEVLEEDTSTPEEESQGLEAASRTEDEGPSAKQASLGSEESAPAEEDSEGASASDANGESASASTSQETEESDSSKSSEEATATPGAADAESDSSQSSESQEDDSAEQAVETTTDVPDVIIAK